MSDENGCGTNAPLNDWLGPQREEIGMEMLRDMWNEGWPGRILLLTFVGAVLLVPVAIYAVIEEQQQWQEFAAKHNCRKVGHVKGHASTGIGTGITSGGTVGTVVTTSVTPDKTGWLCDDGITYWR